LIPEFPCPLLFPPAADVYKALYDGPDPAPTIDSLFRSQSQNSTQQLEIARLKKELSQYDEEFRQLKNQDITIRRLEDEVEVFRHSIEDQVCVWGGGSLPPLLCSIPFSSPPLFPLH
jgi:hypothetical protein